MKTAIYIRGRKLDIANDTSIALTFRSAAFTSVDKLKNSYSNTVKIPRTAQNESLFGAIVFPSSQGDAPYIYHAASIELDGVMVVPSAVAYITEITDDSISLCLLWDSVVKLSAMIAEKRKLNELPYDKSQMVLTWNKTNAANYTKFDMGLAGDDDFTAQHPSIAVNEVLKIVCDTYALPMPPASDIAEFNKWKLPLLNRIDPIITDGEELKENNVTTWYGSSCMLVCERKTNVTNGLYRQWHPIWVGRVGVASGTPPNTELPDIDLPVIKPMIPSAVILPGFGGDIDNDIILPPILERPIPVPDEDTPLPSNPEPTTPPEWVSREVRGIVGNYNGNTDYLEYLVPFKPNLQFVCTGEVRLPIHGNCKLSNAYIMANAKLQLVLMFRPLGVTADYEEEVLLSVDAFNVENGYITYKMSADESAAIPYPLYQLIGDIYNNADVRLQWRCYYEGYEGGYFLKEGAKVGHPDIVGTALYMTAAQQVLRLDSSYFIVPNLPPIGCVDFLKALGQMSGRFLTVESVFNGVQRVTTTRFRSYAEFEQRKAEALDWSNYLVRVLGSVSDMKFKVGDWCQRNTFKYKEGDTLDAVDSVDVFIQNKSLKDEQVAVELPFTAAVARDSKQTLYVPLYTYEEGSTVAEFDAKKDLAYIGEENYGILTNTLRWGRLIKSYEDMLKPLRKAKVLTEQMRIPLVVLHSLDLYRPIYLRQYGSYFAIIEIRTRNNGVCDVELLKL
jgi:hypothetical protein